MYNVLIILIIVENIEGLKFDKFGERTIVRQILACELRNNVGHECWNNKIIITKTQIFAQLPNSCPSNFTCYTVLPVCAWAACLDVQ